MNVFDAHSRIVDDYASYIRSFLNIADPVILDVVEAELAQGKLWPEPLLQFNPAYRSVGRVDELAASGMIHPEIRDIFKGYSLYAHQVDAIRLGMAGKDFVVTSGTGSGKSVTYIGTIFDHLLSHPGTPGVTAVVVYPMNALINSQTEEFNRYRQNYEQATGKAFPITFGQYTGQEKEEARQKMREHPPQILLTNYMMLELLLTRQRERTIRDGIYANLRFLVFDELHTYRGRQGADVAMLIRRIRARCAHEVTMIGTSATMVSGASNAQQRTEVADVATTLFGRPFAPEQVIPEQLARSLAFSGTLPARHELAAAIQGGIDTNAPVEQLKVDPVAVWLENCVALEQADGELIRRKPKRLSEVVEALADDSGLPVEWCRHYLAHMLQWISTVNTAPAGSRRALHDAAFQAAPVYFADGISLHHAGSGRESLHHPGARRLQARRRGQEADLPERLQPRQRACLYLRLTLRQPLGAT